MKLTNFSVSNFRSITKAHEIQMNSMTVIVGKNNVGKSNVLRALDFAMDTIKLYAENPNMLVRNPRSLMRHYSWERDFPISMQDVNSNGHSQIDLNFEMTSDELQNFRNATKTRLQSNLPVRVSFHKNEVTIEIPKRGTASFSNDETKFKAIKYLCDKIDFIYVPTVRTVDETIQVIHTLIANELSVLEKTPEYTNAMAIIESLQQNILDNIASQITTPLKTFVPSVKQVQLYIQQEKRRIAFRRNIEVTIDDGTLTSIEQKGDGIKSLTALAMLNITNSTDRVSIIAIEEPESHLHPEGVRQLFQTILMLSEKHQVILTTHSPLFINRMNLRENIIVDNGKAVSVRKVKEIRDVLGTIVSDNLINAENILVVEGEDDKIALEKLLPCMSVIIKEALSNGTLVIDYLAGAGNLPQKLIYYKNIQCRYCVLLDNDDAGRTAGNKALEQGLASTKEIIYTVCNGSPDAELEDCYNKDIYEQNLFDEFGVSLTAGFRGNGKWSDRIANCFKANGKQWNDPVQKMVKLAVANSVPADPAIALNPHKQTSIESLVRSLEDMLS